MASMSCFGVREEGLLVTDDFEFYPVGEAYFAAQAGGADGFVGGVAARGVGEDEHFVAVDVVEEGFFRLVGEIDSTDGDGDHVGAGGGVGAGHFVEAAIFAGAYDQAGAEGAASDYEFVCHGVLSTILSLATLGYKFDPG